MTIVRQWAVNAVAKVDQKNRYLDMLSPADLNELPIGLKRTINNITYKIAISSAIFHATHAELTLFAKVEIPQHPGELFFGLSGLKLSYDGGIVGDAKLVLLGDVPIDFIGENGKVILKGAFDFKNGIASNNLTYLEIDCKGFKEMGISADVEFPRSLLVPCSASGNPIADDTKKVTGYFQTVVSDWNNILADISLPKFQFVGLKDIVFSVTNATFDFSDQQNSKNISFPAGYESKYVSYPSSDLWRGLYIEKFEVMLPKTFTKRTTNDRISFIAKDLLIDNNGISGNFYAKNILSYSEGSASGWRFSVDQFNVELEANSLVGAGFKGIIGLPISKENDEALKYEAVITSDDKYWLTIAPTEKINFNLWQAKATLDKNSYVKLLVKDDQFLPEANLYGKMDIEGRKNKDDTSSNAIAQFKGIEFKGLRLKTVEPYLSVDYFGYDGELSVGNFPVSIDSIALVSSRKEAILTFGVKVTLMDEGFKADTKVVFNSIFEQNEGLHKWSFKDLGLTAIKLNNVNIGKVILNGELNLLDNDPIYGEGFGGGIQATFQALGAMEVRVRAIFGKKEFRYWFVDGRASFGSGGIPIAPPAPINVNGFVGGVYYRMSKIRQSVSSSSAHLMPEYKPDLAMGLGVKAGILFNVSKDEVCNGLVEFEMAFNRRGGLNYIGLFGSAKFMEKIPIVGDALNAASKVLNDVQDKVSTQLEGLSDVLKIDKLNSIQNLTIKDPQKAAREVSAEVDFSKGLAAYMGISYDFNASTFHANFDIFVNAAKGLLRGVGDKNRAGYAVLHFAPKEWYIYMGTPSDPIGLQFGLGSFSLKTESYFMIGTRIPASPPPPQEVADILGLDLRQLDYMRDLNALGDGRGFALGSRLAIATGDITFLILYANFKAGIGFDLMLKQYPDAHCEENSEPIGINGWYANAQAYAYLQGELGIKVNLWFLKARIPIIKAGVATLLQARLPNPSLFTGYLGVQYDVLGGLIKGRANFKVQFGDECKIINGGQENPVGINVIADMSPKNPENVDVFTAPQVAFNFSVDRDIPIADESGNKIFRIKLEKFELSDDGGKLINGKLEWNSGKDAVSFISKEILPPNTNIRAYTKVSFIQLVDGIWQTVYMEGRKAEEERYIEFKTGIAPQSIPLTNIEYSWPVVNQRNFYRLERNRGFVQLKRGQSYLFRVKGFNQYLAFKKENGVAEPISFNYDSAHVQLRFDLPSSMESNTSYSFELFSKSDAKTTGPISITETKKTDEGDFIQLTNKQAQNVIRTDEGKIILGYSFHSSSFGNFKEKVASITTMNDVFAKVSSDVIDLRKEVNLYEPFELAEVLGTAYTQNKPLLQPVALLDHPYYQEDILPLNYAKYPVNGDITLRRDTATLGFVPVRALPVIFSYVTNLEQGNFNSQFVNQRLPYIYDLPRFYKDDFVELQNQVVNRFLGTPQQNEYHWLIAGKFPFMREGKYKVKYKFILPDGTPGSEAIVDYYNPIR